MKIGKILITIVILIILGDMITLIQLGGNGKDIPDAAISFTVCMSAEEIYKLSRSLYID